MKKIILAFSAVGGIFSGVVPSYATTIYVASLSGLQETPSNSSAGTGTAVATFDNALANLSLTVAFLGLRGNSRGASLNCCAPLGTNAIAALNLPFFPVGSSAGGYSNSFNLLSNASYTNAFRLAHGGTALSARTALLSGFATNAAYINVRSTAFTSGEVRGQVRLVPSVPEPAEWALLIPGAMLAGAMVRRQRRDRRIVRYVLA